WGGQFGVFGGSYSTTIDETGNISKAGVRQYNVNLFGWGMRGGKMGNKEFSNGFNKSGAKFFKFE
ncbi:MAG: hypothetical protein WCY77_11835, partial [Weeksellaceae bacterium]